MAIAIPEAIQTAASAAPALRLCVLGPPEMYAPTGPVRLLPERRCRLLAYLAVRCDWVGRDELATLFWPHRSQAGARSNLRKLLLETRALALPEFESGSAGLRFAVATDLAAFQDLLAAGDAAAAMALVRGPLLQGLDGGDSTAFEDWLGAQRRRVQTLWHEAAASLLPGLAPQAALQLAQRLLEDDPFDEDAVVAALSAHLARGDTHAAQRLYRRHAEALADELGIEPSARVRAAVVSHPAAQPVGGTRAAPAATLATDFFGRDDERGQLLSLLADPAQRLVTVVGCGGVGKSRLAKEVLRACAGQHADGTHWLALDDLSTLEQVAPRLLRELALSLGPHQDPQQRLEHHLADKQLLLVLDNAEHLARLDTWVARLLAAAPRLQILATSRRRLGLASEQPLYLSGLPLPAAWLANTALPEHAGSAVQLFAACARAAHPRFDLAAQLPAVAQVVRAVDGLPLAIMLAASWVRMLPMAELVAEVQQSLDLLAAADEGEERAEHRSVSATFESSWRLLAGAEQRALASLSVMLGRFPRGAACEVAQAPLPLLAGLVDKSLLQVDEQGRFCMHPLIQRFAACKLALDAAQPPAARDRHARAFGRFMAEHVQFDVGDPQASVVAIGTELLNVQAAWRWATERPLFEVLASCAVGLSNYYQTRGPLADGVSQFAQAQAAIDAARSPLGERARDLLWSVAIERAALNFWTGDFRTVEDCARHALAGARAAGNAFGVRTSLNTLALALMRQGRLGDARPLLKEALAMATAAAIHHEVAAYAGNLVGILRELGDNIEALRLAQQALKGHRQFGSTAGQVATHNEIGLILHGLGRTGEAIDHYEQGLAIAGEGGLDLRSAQLLTHLGSACLEDGQVARAREAVKLSLRLTLECNLHSHEPTCRRTFAMIELADGDAARARDHLLAAVGAARRVGTAMVGTPVLRDAAVWLEQAGEPAAALSCVACADAGKASKAPLLRRFQGQRERLAASLDAGARAAAEATGVAMSLPIGLEFAERALDGPERDLSGA